MIPSSTSIYATKIICGDCGSYFGAKVWHSNSKYRRVIYQCNSKFKGSHFCTTPHLYEPEIQEKFLQAFAQYFSQKDAVIKNCQFALNRLKKQESKKAELQDELVAYVRYWAGRPAGLVIVTERSVIAKEIASLIKRLFRYIPDSSVRRTGADSRVYRMEINSPEIVNTILMTLKIENEHEYEGLIQCQLMKVSRMDVQQDCCRRAYIKGVFMTSGSISDPNKGYHMEVVCENEGRAQFIQEIIKGFGVEARIIQRKKYYVVYLKDGEMIVDMLGIMGAHISLMNMENIRIRKDIRNNINRRVNCEAANLNKTVSAAVKQMNDINYIIETKGIGYLPDNLQELALARLENEDASLKELGEMMTPPIGKSGVNHRLRKISEIAEEMRGC